MYHSRWLKSHYLAGFRYGQRLYQHGVHPFDYIDMSKERKAYAQACVPIYQKYYPEILEEIQGIADGLHVSSHTVQSFLFSMYAYTYCGCSCFAYADENQILLGRNSDFMKDIGKMSDSVYYQLENCYSFIGHTTAWCEMEDGINEYGLAVGLTFVYPTCIDIGMNAGMLVRYILERCRTVQEALAFLKCVPIGSAQTLTLVDSHGTICVVECNCQSVVVRKPQGHMIYATNHFICEEMKVYQTDKKDDIYSYERYETMKSMENQKIDSDVLKKLLSGQYGFMCQYEGKVDTIWSVVYDLQEMSIERVEGNPSRKAFQKEKRGCNEIKY